MKHVGSLLLAAATVLALVGVAILPFLNPIWLGFAQGRAEATAWTGWSEVQVREVTGVLLHDLVIGPPDFAIELDGAPVFDERERAHMRDVRAVFAQVFVLAFASALLLVVAWRRSRGSRWVRRGVRVGAASVVVVVAVLGVVFGVAFDAAFEIFHQLFFPAGSYAFDPGSDRLVQLLPGRLWYESSLAFGGVLIGLALGLLAVVRPSRTRR